MPADTPAQPLLFETAAYAQLLTIEDLMRLKRVKSRTTIYAMVKRGELPEPKPENKVCGRPRWRLADVMPGRVA
jgi:predicted DNA-binding transcriptional regulator AlpA